MSFGIIDTSLDTILGEWGGYSWCIEVAESSQEEKHTYLTWYTYLCSFSEVKKKKRRI